MKGSQRRWVDGNGAGSVRSVGYPNEASRLYSSTPSPPPAPLVRDTGFFLTTGLKRDDAFRENGILSQGMRGNCRDIRLRHVDPVASGTNTYKCEF